MVLPVKMSAFAHGEIRVLAVEPPYHLPASTGDLVDAPSVPGRDEQVPVRRNRYGVDMEVIERLLLGTAAELLVRGRDGDMVKAFPAPQQLTGGHVHLHGCRSQHVTVLRTADGGQVGRLGVVGSHKGGAFSGQGQLVKVGRKAASFG